MQIGSMGEEEEQRRSGEVRVNLEFCLKVRKKQHMAGRHFLHQRPLLAISWSEPGVIALVGIKGVINMKAHMCRHGITQWTPEGWRHGRKPGSSMGNGLGRRHRKDVASRIGQASQGGRIRGSPEAGGGGPIEEDIRTIGKHPIGARWVDINKQDEDYPEYRSSLAAKEIKRHPMLELYAATPPLECFRMLSSDVAIETQQSKSKKLMVRDVSRAYFYAPSIRPVYVKIIGEDLQNGRTPRSIGHEHHKEH